jgi:hypothetical protein
MKKAIPTTTSAVPNVDTLLTTPKKKKKTTAPSTTTTTAPPSAEVKSVTPKKKKKSLLLSPPPEEVPLATPSPPKEKKLKKKQFIEDIPQEITKVDANKPIVENKSLGIDNINIILDSVENVSILDIISSTENPDMTNVFNNILAIS